MASLNQQSKFLVNLAEPQRLSRSEQSMKSLAAWITSPHTSALNQCLQSPLSWEYYVPETLSKNCPTGSRIIDGIRLVTTTTTGSSKCSTQTRNVLEIQEWKAGVITPTHINDTVFLKDYGNCYVNGGIKVVRSKAQPWADLKKRILLKIQRHQRIDEILYSIIGDRVSIKAAQEVEHINSFNKFIVHHSSGRQIPIIVRARSFANYIEEIDRQYNIVWNQNAALNHQLSQFSRVGTMNKTFPILDRDGTPLKNAQGNTAFWHESQLLLP